MSTIIRIGWAVLFIVIALYVWRRFFAAKVL